MFDNMENRIKNFLQNKKRSVLVIIGILLLMAIVVIILVTRLHAVEELSESPEVLSESTEPSTTPEDVEDNKEGMKVADEGSLVYESLEHMGEVYWKRWRERLLSEGAVSHEEEVKYSGSNMWQSYIDEMNGKASELEMEFFFYTVAEDYIITLYKTISTGRVKNGKIIISSEREEAYDHVTTASQALEMGIIEYRWMDTERHKYGLAGKLEEFVMLTSQSYQELFQPETALARLLHLEGGTCEQIGRNYEGTCVAYTFADGSRVYYVMSNTRWPVFDFIEKGFCWFPVSTLNEEVAERIVETNRYLEEAEADKLRQVTEGTYNFSEEWREVTDRFVILDEIQGEDIALYGLYGGDGMVLRSGNKVWPIYEYWMSPQMHIPAIYQGDYDHDGTMEYALWTLMGTGTGVSISQLYILEDTESGLQIHEFMHRMVMKELERVTWQWEEETKTLQMYADEIPMGEKVDLSELLSRNEVEFVSVTFENFVRFQEENGQWFMEAEAGIVHTGYVEYSERNIIARAPVIYSSEGRFSLGEITVTREE